MPLFKKKEDKQTNQIDKMFNKALYEMKIHKASPLSNTQNLKDDLLTGYMDNEVVYSIVNRIANKASVIPIQLKDNNDKVIEKHCSLDLIKYPNTTMTWTELLNAHYIHYLSLGNSFLYSHLLPSGQRSSLNVMPAEEMEIITGGWRDPIQGFQLVGSPSIEFPEADVFYSKMFNPRFQEGQWLYGLSPIAVASQLIESYNKGAERLEKSFDNGGPENLVFTATQEMLSIEQQEMLKDFFKEYEGSKNAKKNAYMTIPMNAVKLGSDPVDLSIFDNSIHTLRTLCSVYNVSSILFNDSENATLDNYNQARRDLYNDAVIPLNDSFAERFTNFLGVNNEGLRFEFDYSGVEVLQDTFYSTIDKLNNITFLTDNEKREIIGYAPIQNNTTE